MRGSLARTLVVALFMTGCSSRGSGETVAPPAPVAAAPAAPLTAGVPYTVEAGLPVWSDSYAARYLGDGTTSSYWCTASGPTFPIVATLVPSVPTPITGLDLDTRVSGYETSAIRVVTVERLGAGGAPLDAQTIELAQNAVTSLTFAAPLPASRVRLTFHSNFGGTYAALAEVTLRLGPGTGRPPTPAVAPPALAVAPPAPPGGVPYTVAAGLPFWNDTYSPARMQDATPSTYWCTPMSPTFPITGSLILTAPSTVSAVVFDNRLPGYETSGIQAVTINAMGWAGNVLSTTTAVLPQGTSTRVPLPQPVTASRIDLVFSSNHGGAYAGLAELVVQ